MGNRLSKITTRTGDEGITGLADGSRVSKADLRMHVIGEVDELNSVLGILIACDIPLQIHDCLQLVQHRLFDLGGELSLPGSISIKTEDVTYLEQCLDELNRDLSPLKEFILPGGNLFAGYCHLARAVCRRVERSLVGLKESGLELNPDALVYINRLSDLLFVMARVLVKQGGGIEVYWQAKVPD